MDQPDPSVFANEAPVVDNGSRQRDGVSMFADLRVEGQDGVIAVRVRNLSSGGLMAELPQPIPTDRTIDIDVRGIGRISGRIAWQTAGRIGIAFDQPIDPQRVREPTEGAAAGLSLVPRSGG